jgi:transposase, IS5 family
MRQERTIQATIFEVFAQHEIGCELKAMSQWLDGQPGLVRRVAGDLRRQGVRETGRRGLPAESVLRCALLKQQRQLSYEEQAFHLEDSVSFRAVARLSGRRPGATAASSPAPRRITECCRWARASARR